MAQTNTNPKPKQAKKVVFPNETPAPVENPNPGEELVKRSDVVKEVKDAILAKIRAKAESISKSHGEEVNIATRYDYRLKIEEVIAIYNEIANLQL